jgi:hypothetical protein
MKFDEVNRIAKQEVMQFVFSDSEWDYDRLAEWLEQGNDLPDEVVLWAAFDVYEYAPLLLLNLLENIRETLISFASKIGDLK